MDEELKQAMESVREQQPVAVSIDWYQGTIKLPEIKEFIRANINAASRSFVAIGYYLKYVRDKQLYKEEGYTGISEFAKVEFGISAAQASKFMSINDKFSKDGNSPILMEKYRDFTSSKLSEMLYLTDEQLDQVSITTTKAEIRQIGKPVKKEIETVSFSPAKTESEPKPSYHKCELYDFHIPGKGCSECCHDKTDADCPYDRTEYFAEIKRQEEWRIHCIVLEEMCDTICEMMSYVLEKNNYSMDAIKSLSRKDQEFSFGFGDDGNGHSKYMSRCKSERYYVETFDETRKWVFEAGEVDQQIWNINYRAWKENQPQHDSEQKQEKHCLHKAGIECNIVNLKEVATNLGADCNGKCCWECKEDCGAQCNPAVENQYQADNSSYDESPAETVKDIPETMNDKLEIVDNELEFEDDVDETVSECRETVSKITETVINEVEIVSEEVETVEADIVQTVPEETVPDKESEYSPKYFLKEQKRKLNEMIAVDGVPIIILERQKTIVCALASMVCDLEDTVPEKLEVIQPELPILKNNDQRKDFIDAYLTWPVWIDQKETNERYYRYELSDKVAMVVKVSLRHSWQSKTAEFGSEKYFLIGIKYEYGLKGSTFTEDATRTFADCETNKTALVDYLKDVQKK